MCLVYRTYNRKFLDGCRQPTTLLLYRERNRRSELFETTISGSGDTLFERTRRGSELLCATSEGHFALTLAAARCSNTYSLRVYGLRGNNRVMEFRLFRRGNSNNRITKQSRHACGFSIYLLRSTPVVYLLRSSSRAKEWHKVCSSSSSTTTWSPISLRLSRTTSCCDVSYNTGICARQNDILRSINICAERFCIGWTRF